MNTYKIKLNTIKAVRTKNNKSKMVRLLDAAGSFSSMNSGGDLVGSKSFPSPCIPGLCSGLLAW